ncbi:MAG: ribosome silencing factor [Planctomycetaceae bacterium]|nr:ribosome silencing factor [Planctomycetaceae bacterium]
MPTLETQRQRSLEDACRCAQTADEFRGRDTLVLDLTEITPVFDYFVITSGNNPRQMRALAEEIRLMMKARGNRTHGTEGDNGEANWLVQDYGDIVLHVFQPETRKLYDLERLWADARRIDWRSELGLPATAAVSSL